MGWATVVQTSGSTTVRGVRSVGPASGSATSGVGLRMGVGLGQTVGRSERRAHRLGVEVRSVHLFFRADQRVGRVIVSPARNRYRWAEYHGSTSLTARRLWRSSTTGPPVAAPSG